MKKYLFYTLITMLISCNKNIYVEDVSQGKKLETAINISTEEFFMKRMQNKLRKVNVGYWDILYEDSSFIYIGYPRLKGIFSNRRIIDTLYKTDVILLKQILPKYKEIQGFVMRQKIYEPLQTYLSSKGEIPLLYLEEKMEYKLEPQFIKIQINAIDTSHISKMYIFLIDAKTLEIKDIRN